MEAKAFKEASALRTGICRPDRIFQSGLRILRLYKVLERCKKSLWTENADSPKILALIALASLIYLCYFARTRTKEKKINDSVKRN